ncbi:formamidopyrimidine-DNA glycosylase [Spiroplasma chinense]|uniref:Formamidopyrimidine-DNA glycosylase n=1 Tax=Spiroplasma chinense TaxID=216932 RepID=A0A5B9Y4W3_9MOLU|nr:DNA-formamidopyrimidine glycosylase [Spiroplasma chinense]QEH62208.1 formamidopyrimidine-DNA glycosylase [Spiroplasma chinense]
MPELPEVETVIRVLNEKLKNLKVTKVEMFYPKLLKSSISIEDFSQDLKGRVIEKVDRIAKHILFILGDKVLISHLRMEGKWFVFDKDNEQDIKHTLARFELSENKVMIYSDTRKFGTLHYQDIKEFKKLKPIVTVGPEPFDPIVNGNFLHEKIKKSTKAIKTILLDQTIISGIGNIYANEIMFDAKISPFRAGKDISPEEAQRIVDSSVKILNRAIELGGSTIDTYQPEQGIDGKFQNELKVHMKNKTTCLVCGGEIKKVQLNGRGTYYCELCQK